MPCERYREELAGVAAGLPLPEGLKAHLASCGACREEQRVLRQALALADAEMAGLAVAEPSATLGARIRRSAAVAEPPSGSRFGWLWPATAVAATLLVALAVAASRRTPPTHEPRVAREAYQPRAEGRTRATEAGDQPVFAPATPSVPRVAEGPFTPRSANPLGRRGVRSPGGSLAASRAAVPRYHAAREPEVLVPPGEAEALLRFVALVHRDRLVPSAFDSAGRPSSQMAVLASIDIQPLEIVPLDPAETSGT